MEDILLSEAEFAALSAVDGTRTQPEMKPAVELRLRTLLLTERRAWPNGPLWRTFLGNRLVRRGRGSSG